jgi:hypothetical protein
LGSQGRQSPRIVGTCRARRQQGDVPGQEEERKDERRAAVYVRAS